MKFEVYVKDRRRQEDVCASTPEMAYRGICYFYMPETPVTIVDTETHESRTYTRRLDKSGNMLEIVQH